MEDYTLQIFLGSHECCIKLPIRSQQASGAPIGRQKLCIFTACHALSDVFSLAVNNDGPSREKYGLPSIAALTADQSNSRLNPTTLHGAMVSSHLGVPGIEATEWLRWLRLPP